MIIAVCDPKGIAIPYTLSCKNRLSFYNIDDTIVSGRFVHIFK